VLDCGLPTWRNSSVPSAADDLAAIIADAGPIPFVEYMRIALYGRNGFYTQAGSAGRRGDFITSPEVGPLFGTVVAAALDTWWDELGRPEHFDVVEAGAGPGTLARAIRAAAPRCATAMRYVAVEISAAQRARHPEDVMSAGTMPEGPITGVVLANELLDNVPFRLFVFDSGWKEAYVDMAPGGGLAEVLRPVDVVPSVLPAHAAHGTRLPVQDDAASWVRDALARIARGRLVVIDYCSLATADLASMPWRAWLRTYREHQRGEHYLRNVGLQDITAQVCLDQLPEGSVSTDQAAFLRAHGIDSLVEAGRQYWHEHAAMPDLAAMKMRSRVAESEALLDPSGLGGFRVVEWLKATK
jgi:SAM-dependent MidA family methyltransferase